MWGTRCSTHFDDLLASLFGQKNTGLWIYDTFEATVLNYSLLQIFETSN